MGNKVALALSVLATAVTVSACGGTQVVERTDRHDDAGGARSGSTATPTRARAATRRASTAPSSASARAPKTACSTWSPTTAASSSSERLVAGIVNVSVAPADQGHGRTVRPMRDAFLRIDAPGRRTATRCRTASRFGQTMLGIGSDDYLERVDVERQVHGESLAGVNGGVIRTGRNAARRRDLRHHRERLPADSREAPLLRLGLRPESRGAALQRTGGADRPDPAVRRRTQADLLDGAGTLGRGTAPALSGGPRCRDSSAWTAAATRRSPSGRPRIPASVEAAVAAFREELEHGLHRDGHARPRPCRARARAAARRAELVIMRRPIAGG